MAAPSDEGRSPGSGRGGKSFALSRLLTRAEAASLAGMVLSIASLFLIWPVSLGGAVAALALATNPTRMGALIPEVRWPVTGGAILAGLLLALSPSPGSRVPLAFVQALCGIVCFIVAMLHFGMLPGPLVELLGGALLTFGAVDRLNRSSPAGT